MSVDGGDDADGGSRDVVVPLRVYKAVTVFSTLFAVVLVLGGFVILDAATQRATAPVDEIDPLLLVVGLASLVAGAAVYAYGTRFRAAGMGTPKDEPDEADTDG